jgi:hypothetical protein
MADKFDRAQTLGKYVAELVRRKALAAIAEHDQELSKSYREIAEGIRRDLRATGFTIDEVQAVLEKQFASSRNARLRIMEQAIIDAARASRTVDRDTFDAIFGTEPEDLPKPEDAPRPLDRAFAPASVHVLTPRRASAAKPPSTD